MTDELNNKSLTLINDLEGLTQKATEKQKILKELISSVNLRKILKKTNTSMKDLKFITLQQFIQQNQLSFNHDQYSDNYDYNDRYETQLQRRITQLKIFLEMQHRLFDHPKKNTSSKKSSRVKLLTPKQLKYSHSTNNLPKSSRKQRNVKFSSNDDQLDICYAKSKRTNHSRRQPSTSSSRFTRQHSNIELQTHRKLKEVQIFQTFTEGRPYIQEYCNQIGLNIDKNQIQRLKTSPVPSSSRKRQCCNEVGKITKQIPGKKIQFVQNQYQNGPQLLKIKKDPNYWIKNKQKNNNVTHQKNQNQYDMIPLKNQKIKAKLSQKFLKNTQRQACKQLITEVKRYEEINKKCIKKLKSIEKNDLKSRQKILQLSSRQKIIKKDNIERLKDRITSKHQNNK